jgi:oligosaccharide repeat unit polymerase
MEMLSSAWLPEVGLVCLALFARVLQGSWLAPSAFAPAAWSVFIALPLLALSDRVSASSVWTIVALVFCSQLGSLLVESTRRRAVVPFQSVIDQVFVQRAVRYSIVFTSVALVGSLAYAVEGLRRFNLSFTLESFLSLGALFYPGLIGGEPDPWWLQLSKIWVFPAVLLGGIVAAFDVPRAKKALGALAILPALVLGVTVASRFTTTMAVCCCVASYLAAKTYCTGGLYRVGKKTILVAVSLGLSCTILYVLLGVVRGHEYNDSEDVSVAVRGNLLGYLPVFDRWLQDKTNDKSLTWGANSLAGVYDQLGFKKREVALGYDPVVLDSGVTSNIATAFRGLIQDFSFPGAMVVCCIVGMFAGASYNASCRRELSGTVIVSGYYAFLLWSPIISIANYNTFVLALLVGWLLARRAQTVIGITRRRSRSDWGLQQMATGGKTLSGSSTG